VRYHLALQPRCLATLVANLPYNSPISVELLADYTATRV